MNVAKQLYQLQETDLKLESVEQALKKLTSQLGESQEVTKTQSELASEQQHLEELSKQQHSAEWESEDRGTRITALEQKLYDGTIKNPKELSNLQSEVNGLKKQRDQLEDKALEIMDQVELTETKVNTINAKLDELKTEWQRQQQHLSTEIVQVKTTLSSLGDERQQLVAKIDPQAVDFYHRLRKGKQQAVAKIEQGICSGCRISLPVTELQRARGDSLVQCSSCGRILFLA